MPTITDPAELINKLDAMAATGEVAFDTETTGLKPFEGDRICSFSIYHPDVGSSFIPVRQQGLGTENMPEEAMVELKRIFKPEVLVIGHNLSHDINFCRAEDLWEETTPVFDTMYAAFLHHDGRTSYRLKGPGALSDTVLHDLEASRERDRVEEFKKAHPGITYDFIPIDILGPYAEKDVIIAWRLRATLETEILSRDSLYEKLLSDEMRWVKMVTLLSATGLLFDFDRATEIESDHSHRMVELTTKLGEAAWPGFNPNSPRDCMALMRQNDIDAENTEANTMWLYVDKLPILKDIITVRMLGKSLSSYIRPWKNAAMRGGGRVYSSWGATGHGYGDDYGQTRTGRLRCRQPNLTGVPRYNSDGDMIHREKECYVAPEGWTFGALDLSQAEIRVGAGYADCKPMLDILQNPPTLPDGTRNPAGDVHGGVANDLGMPRSKAKRVVFGGGLYGAGDEKMSKTMTDELHEQISVEQAGRWLRSFDRKYPEFKKVRKDAERTAYKRGALRLWNGRWMILGPQDQEHKAFDWIVQGGIAAFMKEWMFKIQDHIDERGMRSRMVLQIHDEVVLEMPKEEVDALGKFATLAEGIGPEGGFKVPMYTEVRTGDRWSDL